MEPITLRIQSQLADDLAEEATEAGFSSWSEYIRHLLYHRDALTESPPIGIGQTTSDIESQGLPIESLDELLTLVSEMDDRIDELEQEVVDIRTTADESTATTVSPDTTDETQPESSPEAEQSGDETDRSDSPADEFSGLEQWLRENGPESDDAQEIMIAAAHILEADGPLKTGELKDRLAERYPDAANYSSQETLWGSTVERLYEQTPGFEKPAYGIYQFDVSQTMPAETEQK